MGVPCHYVLLSKTSATPHVFLCYSVFKNLLLCLKNLLPLSLFLCYSVFNNLLLLYKKNLGILEKGFLSDEVLRVQDSNMRPPGYEPGELPTAPTRDINQRYRLIELVLILNCVCKGTTFYPNYQIISKKILLSCGFIGTFHHTISTFSKSSKWSITCSAPAFSRLSRLPFP